VRKQDCNSVTTSTAYAATHRSLARLRAMSVSPSRKRNRSHNWGSNLRDFAVSERKAPKITVAPRPSRKRTKRARKPTVAPHTDEWHRVISTIAAEEDIDEILISATDPDRDDLDGSDIAMSTATPLPITTLTASNSTIKALIAQF